MRYIKTFKIFEADAPIEPGNKSWKISTFMKDTSIPHDMQMDIHDMSYELRDEGYSISYQWWPPYDKDSKSYQRNKYPSISITKRFDEENYGGFNTGSLEEISYVDIKDFCERVISYLDEVDYNVNIKFRKENLANSGSSGSSGTSEYNLNDSEDKDVVTSKYFKIDMISRDVYGDVNESKQLDQSVIDECKDILLELEDKGIKTNIHSYINDQQYNRIINLKKNWIQFFFNRKEEFDYSDIEDVVERLKSYLSEYNLHINWQSPTERQENKPTIKNEYLINPMNFQSEGFKTQCELHFYSN